MTYAYMLLFNYMHEEFSWTDGIIVGWMISFLLNEIKQVYKIVVLFFNPFLKKKEVCFDLMVSIESYVHLNQKVYESPWNISSNSDTKLCVISIESYVYLNQKIYMSRCAKFQVILTPSHVSYGKNHCTICIIWPTNR